MATKHIPIRTCIVTGEKKPKNELMRFVLTASGDVIVDPRDKAKGRGANMSMNVEAFDLAIKKRALERSLKLKSQLSVTKVAELREKFIEAIEEKKFRKGNQSVTIKLSKDEYDKALSSNG